MVHFIFRKIWSKYELKKLTVDLADGAFNIVKLACLIRCLREYGVDLTLCVGPSMLPTFNRSGDLVLLERFSVRNQQIKAGDVVVAKNAQSPRYTICKRVLGLEGDQIRVQQATGTELPHVTTVPKGHVWLQGDNIINSTDSRHYGPVPYALLQGRVFVKIWPPHEAKWVNSQVPASAMVKQC